jgi:hypothetical protein
VNRLFVTLLVIGLSISLPGFAQDFKAPQGVPLLAGIYTSSLRHPHDFMSESDLIDLAARVNESSSYSARRFRQLAAQVARDLAAGNKWDAAYSGCNTDTYNYAFSYEPQPIHGVDHVPKVRSDMGLAASVVPARRCSGGLARRSLWRSQAAD